MEVTRLSFALGAAVTGIDVSDIDDATYDVIHEAFLEHQILVFCDQDLTPQQQIKFSEHYGEVEVHLAKDHLHPETGRKALYVAHRFTVGIENMPDEESRPILDAIFEHQLNDELIYRHKWQLGDMIMWDNRCTTHHAYGGIPAGQIRHMHRTSLIGDVPF